jgi:Protein of unknown function (DUF2490)
MKSNVPPRPPTQPITTFVRYLVRSVLVVCAISLAAPCAAQEPEVDVPETPPPGEERGTLFVPGVYLGVVTPLQERVALNVYGFYFGEVDVPVAQVDLAIRPTKFLTITPSYLYYEVPPSGLNKAATRPANFTDTFEEDQFRIDGTLHFSIRALEIHSRAMYVRRFRPTDELDRYRYRIGIARPVPVKGNTWKPFATYEKFYEPSNGGWNRDRVITGVTLPLWKTVSFQPAYIWENNRAVPGLRDFEYLQFGLIVRTK